MTQTVPAEICSYGPCKLVLDTSGSAELAKLTLGLSIALPIAQLNMLLQQTPITKEHTNITINDTTEKAPNTCKTTLRDNVSQKEKENDLSQSTCDPSPQAQGPFNKVEQKLVQPCAPQVCQKPDNSQELVKGEPEQGPQAHPNRPQQPKPLQANTSENNRHQLASSHKVKPDDQAKMSEPKSSQPISAGLKQTTTRAPFPLLGPGLPADFDPSKALEALEALQEQSLPQEKPTHQLLKLKKPTGTTMTCTSLSSGQAFTGKEPAASAPCPAPAVTGAPVRPRNPTSSLPQMFQMFQFHSSPAEPGMKTLMGDVGTKKAKTVQADVVEQQNESSAVQPGKLPTSLTAMSLPTLETLMGRPLSNEEASANKTLTAPMTSTSQDVDPPQQTRNSVAPGDDVVSNRTAPSLGAPPTGQELDEDSACAGPKPANQTLPSGSLDLEEAKQAPLVHTHEQPSLNLNGYGIQELTSVASSIRSTPSLTELHLSYNKIKDVTPIGMLLSTNKNLEILHLSGNQIIDLSPFTTALSMNGTLKHLYLSSNGISDVGPLCVLKSNTGLQNLDLSCNAIEKIEPLATALESNRRLSTLLLSGNKIGDICQLCASMRKNNTLQVLRLNGNKIKDANDLADALRINKALRKVDLGGNLIEDVVELADAVPGNGHLQEVILSRNPGIKHGTIREHLGRDRRVVL